MKTIVIAAITTLMLGATAFAGSATSDGDVYEGRGCAGKDHTASIEKPAERDDSAIIIS